MRKETLGPDGISLADADFGDSLGIDFAASVFEAPLEERILEPTMGGLPRDARRGGGLGHAHAKEQVYPE